MNSSDHERPSERFNLIFGLGVALNLGYVVVEAVFGILADSLALLADAGHNLTDVLGLLLAWGAGLLARRVPTARYTYGFRRTTIYAALANAVILLIAIGGIAWEAVHRLAKPPEVASLTVVWVAAVGMALNFATAWLFFEDRKKDLNIRGAFVHMAADGAISAAVVLSGLVIYFTGQVWVDPAISLLIVVVIGAGTWGLLRDSVNLSLDAVPREIEPGAVADYLASLPGVEAVHDLHIWAISTTQTAMTAHLVKPDSRGDDDLLLQIRQELMDRFHIGHPTIQWERSVDPPACAHH